MRKLLLAACLALAACGGSSPSPPPPLQPPISGWTQFFGSEFTPPNFDFPSAPGSAHYVVEPGSVQLGQTVTLIFQISGAGTWGFIDPNDAAGPPRVALFLWERGDNLSGQAINGVNFETFREWHGAVDITAPGTYTLSAKLDPALWTGVFGQHPSAAEFQQLLSNLYGIGFTFGGTSSYGHGVYSATGSFHFQLIGYTVQ